MNNKEKILTILLSNINKYKEKYSYIPDGLIDFEKIIKDAVNEGYNSNLEEESNNCIKNINNIIDKSIYIEITKLLNSEKIIDITLNFINKAFKSKSKCKDLKYNELCLELDKLNKFYQKFDFSENVTPDNLIDIINKSEKLNIILSKIFEINKNLIVSGDFKQGDNSEFIINLIDVYCFINKIEIKEPVIDIPVVNDVDDRFFIKEITSIPLLSVEEEKELARRVKYNNDEKAKEKLIYHNLRLVLSIAYKCTVGVNVDLKDLFQEGSMGLMIAASKFDVDKGNKFSTYATWWIRQHIQRYISDNGRTIRIPVHVYEELKKFKRQLLDYEQKYGYKLSREEAAKEFGMSISKVNYLMNIQESIVSLDMSIDSGDDKDASLLDFIEDENSCIEKKIVDDFTPSDILDLFERSRLTTRERNIILHRFGFIDGEEKTLEYVGQLYGVTRERIRQIERTALRKLKRVLARDMSQMGINIDGRRTTVIDPHKTVFAIFNISKDLYEKVYLRLTDAEKIYLNTCFDSNHVLKFNFKYIEKDETFKLLKQRISLLAEEILEEEKNRKNNNSKKNGTYSCEKIYSGMPFSKYILGLGDREQLILALQYGFFGEKFTQEDVAYMLEMNLEEIEKITKTLLLTYKNNLYRYQNCELTGNEYQEVCDNVRRKIHLLIKK